MLNNNNTTMIQTLDQLKEKAPSVFATRPHQKMSKHYQFVNTADLIDKFMNDGWNLSAGTQSGIGLFSKHEVRLRHGAIPQVGDSIPEIILQNSHNGTTAFSVTTGLHRLVCSNGLTIPSSVSQSLKVLHKNFDMGEVRRITDQFAERLPLISGSVGKMSSRILTLDEQVDYVKKAQNIRWKNGEKPVGLSYEEILQPLRPADADLNMWNTFNIVQEKFVRGGLGYKGPKKFTRMKELKNLSVVNKINTELWELADSLC